MVPRTARLLLACSLLLFAGCAIVLDASTDLGAHCRFEGDEDTTCGECIGRNCQAEVDACCGEAECANDLDALDDCGRGDVVGCLELYRSSGPLGTCAEKHCQSACDPHSSDV